jgi:hypothetical protein
MLTSIYYKIKYVILDTTNKLSDQMIYGKVVFTPKDETKQENKELMNQDLDKIGNTSAAKKYKIESSLIGLTIFGWMMIHGLKIGFKYCPWKK